jgi:hypothetical protein
MPMHLKPHVIGAIGPEEPESYNRSALPKPSSSPSFFPHLNLPKTEHALSRNLSSTT